MMRSILLVLQREISVRVRRRAFLLATFLTPLLFVVIAFVPALLMRMDTGQSYSLGVVDLSDSLSQELEGGRLISLHPIDTARLGDIETILQDSALDAVLVIPPDAVNQPRNFRLFASKQPSLDVMTNLERELKTAVENRRIASYHIPHLDSIMEAVGADVSVKTVTIGEEGEAKETNAAITAGIGYILGILTYMLIMISGSMVMQGVIEEKSNRIVEVLLSSVTSFQLLTGKILGIAAVFLLQLLIWVVLIAVLLPLGAFFLPEGGAEALAEMQSSMPMDPGLGIDPNAMGALGEILGPLMSVNFGAILGAFFIYFVLGYLLYAAAFAAVGSALEEGSSDTGQLTLPLTLPMIVAFFVMINAVKNPDGPLSFWFSMIPFTSPIIMPLRVAYGVPAWELVLSVGLLVLTFVLMTWVAARVYSRGILMYGKSYGWRDIWKWLRG